MKQESYMQLLHMIRDDLRDVGGNLQCAATDVEIEELQKSSQREFGIRLPSSYMKFLTITNGLSWAGVAIFGTSETPITGFPDRLISAFIESNIGFRNTSPLFQNYLVFGSDGDSLLSYNITNGLYEVFTVFMTPLASFSTFEDMTSQVLKKQM